MKCFEFFKYTIMLALINSFALSAQTLTTDDKVDILLARGKYQTALSLLDSLIVSDTFKADNYLRAAEAYQGLYQHDKALKLINTAIKLDSSKAGFYGSLGRSYSFLGNYSSACKAYTYALKLEPGNTILLQNLAGALLNNSHYSEAAAIYRKLISLDSINAFFHGQAGYCALKNDSLALSAKYYEQAFSLNPLNINYAQQLAINYIVLNKIQPADSLINLCLITHPEESLLFKLKGDIHFKMKHYDYAVDAYDKAISLGDNSAQSFQKLGISCYFHIKSSDSLNSETKKEFAEKGKSALEASLMIEGENPVTSFYLGILYSRLGYFQQSLDCLSKAVKFSAPDFLAEIYQIMGDNYTKLKNFRDAAALYKKSLYLNAVNEAAFENIFHIYYGVSVKREDLLRFYREFLESNPGLDGSIKNQITEKIQMVEKEFETLNLKKNNPK